MGCHESRKNEEGKGLETDAIPGPIEDRRVEVSREMKGGRNGLKALREIALMLNLHLRIREQSQLMFCDRIE